MAQKSDNIRLIWITPRFPLGTPDGARLATRSLLEHLARLGVGIDLMCLLPAGEQANPAEAQSQLKLLSCSIISRSRSFLRRLPVLKTPFTFRTFASAAVRQNLKEHLTSLLKSTAPAQHVFLVFDALHPFASLSESDLQDLARHCRGTVYRAHNVESVLWDQCEKRARTPWFRWFFGWQTRLVRTFERRVSESVSLIAPVSEDDAAVFRLLAPKTAMAVTPIGMDFPEENGLRPVRESAKLELLFIGRLDWLPNRNGLLWFLETVWPRLAGKRQNVSLRIAGVGDGRWLHRFQNTPGVEFLGKVDDLQPLYESCSLSIAPLFQGSGTRVKIIEAARYARPVLTTALGAEGTGLIPDRSYFRAETEETWLSALHTITPEMCQEVGLTAYRTLRPRFDGKMIAAHFTEALSTI